MISVFSLTLIATSLLFLTLSFKPACTICKQSEHIGWKILLGLITLFLLSYIAFFIHLLTHSHTSNYAIENNLSLILFAGSIFVKMVISLSLKSIESINEIAYQEKYNSLHDSLTGLANRKYFLQELNEKVKQSTAFSVFIIDISRFKQINDVLGHNFADQLLVKVADSIKSGVEDRFFLSRVGGDQFTLISNIVTDDGINDLIMKINQLLQLPFNIDTYQLRVDITCGGTLFPKNSEQVISLLQQADIALNAAKEKGSDYIIYNEKLDNDAKSRLEISNKLHSALEGNEFEVYYQPIVKVQSVDGYHFEALIRWPLKEGGFIPPDQFIPIAEQNNQIRKITFFVLNTICKNLLELKQAGINACVHINLSARDLQDNQISKELAKLIKEGALSPHQLVLEVTETAVMKDLSTAKKELHKLCEQGFLISLDDFGTGYSSLSMLLELPIHQIKIDRSFVMSMHKEEIGYQIVKSIIFMAHNLKCTVVAEGVETKDIIEQLVSLDCDYLQGYYYSKPLAFSSLIEYCQQSSK